MAFPEKLRDREGVYYRVRCKGPDGKYRTLKDSAGRTLKFRTRRAAERAGRDSEAEDDAKARRGRWVAPEDGRITLREYVYGHDGDDDDAGWLGRQDLAESTMQTYGHCLKRIMPAFGDTAIADIIGNAVDAWEVREKAAGAASSAAGYRRVLHLILEDAVADGLRADNPAARRRNRGRRAGRSTSRGPEKRITNPLGILLLAERAALLTGRDDEFVATVLKGYTGLRHGEIVGLEPKYVREEAIRVEAQLYELDAGMVHGPPKDDSYRTVAAPRWLTRLVRDHIGRTAPKPCTCHGTVFVFRGRGTGRRGSREGATLADVAREAGTSTGTVSNVLNYPGRVAERTRRRVETAIAEMGFVRGGQVVEEAAHWRRSGFATWVFTPAATGWYPAKSPQPRHPVPILAEPWPGVPARGRGAAARATASWVPIQSGLTGHGLRHTHRTVLEEIGTPKVLMDERMGHMDSSVSALYAHVTDRMSMRLIADLTELWEESLAARRGMHPRSSVAVLDALLRSPAALDR